LQETERIKEDQALIYKRIYLKIPTWERLNRLKNAYQDFDQLINDLIAENERLAEEKGIELVRVEGLRLQIAELKGEPNKENVN